MQAPLNKSESFIIREATANFSAVLSLAIVGARYLDETKMERASNTQLADEISDLVFGEMIRILTIAKGNR